MTKPEIRAIVRARKQAMEKAEILRRSQALAEMLFAAEVYRTAKSVYGYYPCNQEVRILPILKRAMTEGKRAALPKVIGRELRFIPMDDLSQIAPGYCGIPEPVADGPAAEDETALVLLPGLAFTLSGQRIGYGGGFYDRFLAREPSHPTIALCYDFQIFQALPTQAHDRPVDLVLWA